MKLLSKSGKLAPVIFAVALLSLLLSFVPMENAGAAADAGSGGSGSCGSGACAGASSRNGYGWYEFSSDSNASVKPRGMRNGEVWSTVQSRCRNIGANKVMAFLVLTKRNGSAADGTVYDYTSAYVSGTLSTGNNPDAYKGDNGHPWVTNPNARARYVSTGLPMSQWEQTVGWFCWTDSNWSVTPTSQVGVSSGSGFTYYSGTRNVNIGQTVNFRHTVKNNGPTATNSVVRGSTTNSNSVISSMGGLSNVTFLSNNSSSGASKSFSGGSSGNMRSYKVEPGDAGKTVCQAVSATPRSNSNSGSIASTRACFKVEETYSLTLTSQIRNGSGAFTTSDITAQPGDRITFRHRITNNGPAVTNAAITGTTNNSGGLSFPATTGISLPNRSGVNAYSERTSAAYIVQPNDVSDTARYCQRVGSSRTSHNNTARKYSNYACFRAPYNYTITPRAPDNLPSSAEAGSTVTNIRGDVLNNGPTKSHSTTVWQLTSFVRRAGQAVGYAVNNGTAPCGFGESNALYNGTFFGAGCNSLARGNGSIPSGVTRNLNAASVRVPSDLEVGDRFCFAVSARNRTHSPGSTPWRHSAPSCIIISKKPKVNILGGDLWVRGGTAANSRVATSTTNNTAGIYGSFVEYALATRGNVTGMSSASGYQGRSTVNALCGVSLLTFGNNGLDNTGCSNQDIGTYSRLPSTTPRLQDRFTANSGNLSGTVSLNGRNGTFSAQNNISISSSTINSGQSVIIVAPNANVTINGDIEYDDGDLRSVSDIPQVVIIARNIFINAAVNKVDAWLVANGEEAGHGYINTCGNGTSLGAGLNADTCDEPLLVNGPVIANHLLMRRTAGAGSLSRAGDPSEVFNLRPDAYLWMANRISAGVGLPTTATRELPPKY